MCYFGIHVNLPQFFPGGMMGSLNGPSFLSRTTEGPLYLGSGNARVTKPAGDQVGSSPLPIFFLFSPFLSTDQTWNVEAII